MKRLFARSPTLDTVLMIEKTIENQSGEFNKREIWRKVPKKVMWQTFMVAIEYLLDINKIGIDKEGKIAYIWSPNAARAYYNRIDFGRKNEASIKHKICR